MKPRGYTLIEVLIAGVLLTILLVPLGYIVIQTGAGRRRADVALQALQLAREAWGVAAVTPIDSLTDSTWEVAAQGRRFRVERDVWDSSDALRAHPVSGPARGARATSRPASAFDALDAAAAARNRTGPVEVSICVDDLSATPSAPDDAWHRGASSADSSGDRTDAVFCWRYLRSRYLVR